MKMDSKQRRTWAEIDLSAAEENFRLIRGAMRPQTALCCVIKADAYGHGAVQLAQLYEKLGADWFAVSNIEEAVQLRRSGIGKPVLILGYTPPACAGELAEMNISQCVYSEEYGTALEACAAEENVTVKIHLKMDTGMGRIGFRCRREEASDSDELSEALKLCRMPHLEPEGIFTHFAVADEGEGGEEYTRRQYACFCRAIRTLEEGGIRFRLRHCSNSAAILDYPEFQLDMVRAGVILYGLQPSGALRRPLPLRPVMSVKSVISHLKTLEPGDAVSYGCTFTAKQRLRAATVPIGYADGFWRENAGKTCICVQGRPVRILGRVCMDQLMVDVTGIEGLSVGDEVTVFGSAPAQTVEQIAANCGTIGYEILCALGARVPRVYLRNGKICYIRDNNLSIRTWEEEK